MTLKWTEVLFPQDWTLENENYSFQIQHPTQTPDLDFVHQLTDGTVILSFDQSRFRFPLDLQQPRMQSPFSSEINLYPSVAHPNSHPLRKTWTQNSKVSRLDPKLALPITQLNKSQWQMRMKIIINLLQLSQTLSRMNPQQVTSSMS